MTIEEEDELDKSIDDIEEEEDREIVVERPFPFMMKQLKLLGNNKANKARNLKDCRGLLNYFKCQIQQERKLTKGKILITSEMPMERINEFLDDGKEKCKKEEVINLINSIRKSFEGCIIVNYKDKIDAREFLC